MHTNYTEETAMKFNEKLNEYIEKLDLTAKELSNVSGLSEATLSRYRSGERMPETNSEVFEQLYTAIASVAEQKNIPDITKESVKKSFLDCSNFVTTDKEQLLRNFNTLVTVMNINITGLCRHTNYDASTISRFRNGSRQPSDPEKFASAVAGYISKELTSANDISTLAELLNCSADDISADSKRYEKIKTWLLEEQSIGEENISKFLTKLNEFDLNEYIKAIHFDKLKVPSLPFQLPTSKSYFGLKEMMNSELDFLKATVLSKSTAPVTMYSDMPMGEMAKDPDFPKKWMFGMAMMLKKGLHLNQIHNLDRSFEDMMLGLESWIPMYMTGQISPYYLKNVQGSVFHHLLKVSGAAALTGEAIAGHHETGKYYLTKSKKEIEYYARRAQELLAGAHPLMDIYRGDRAKEYSAFLLAASNREGRRRSILSTLPLYTMSAALLSDILERNGVSVSARQTIFEFVRAQKARVYSTLEHSEIEDDAPIITREEFLAHPPSLDLSGAFFEQDIPYSYEEYLAHLEETEKFVREHPNYTFKKSQAHAFRNLQIFIFEGQWAMVSKLKSPAVHFVTRHPRLREAIECFIPPVVERA